MARAEGTVMRALLFALALAGCLPTDPTGPDGDPHGVFELLEVRSWTLPSTTLAMDSDRAGGVWVIFEGENTLVHLGPYAQPIAEIAFDDEGDRGDIVGLAVADDVAWVAYNGHDNMLRAFDLVTGEQRQSFASETGLWDVDVFEDELRYSVIWDTVVGLDRARGGERWRRAYDGQCCGIQRGIASMTEDLVWVSTLEGRVFLVDRKVGVIGSGEHHLAPTYVQNGGHRDLGWDGAYLLIQDDRRIHWFEPQF